MRLLDGMLLFHGSYTTVEQIDLGLCSTGKDFGQGFYLTTDVNQARSFLKNVVVRAREKCLIPMSQSHGFVSSYRFRQPKEPLKVHTFPSADRDWLWYIASNRRSKLASILPDYIADIANSDVVIGKVANDNTNPVITTYLNGLFGDMLSDRAIESAVERLMPDHLVDQYCFLTEQAIACLEFQEARKYAIV